MSSLPAQTHSALREQIALDGRAVHAADPDTWLGLYTAAGSKLTTPAEVRVRVTDGPAMPRTPSAMGGGSSGKLALGHGRVPDGQHGRRVRRLSVPALLAAETVDPATGVGDAGGVRELRSQDTLLVPGLAVGSAEESVRLVVGRGVELVGGLWHAECHS